MWVLDFICSDICSLQAAFKGTTRQWLKIPDLALEIITRVLEMLYPSSLLYSPWEGDGESCRDVYDW
jgi:hypothetical protein